MIIPQVSIWLIRNNMRASALLIFLFLVTVQTALAQPQSISISEVLRSVQNNLPQLEAFRQQAAAAQQDIQLSKNSMVPELTAGYQVNMATINNITGMSYPGFLLPISGPPSAGNDLNFVPGSALGALIKWNPISFGLRNASIEKAVAQFRQANAIYNEQLFRYQYGAINVYLEAVYYKQLLKTLQAATQRNEIGLEQSLVLTKNGLRPGIDTAQFQSAIAQSEMDLLQTERMYDQQLTELSRLTGINASAENIVLTDTSFNQSAQLPVDTSSLIIHHPYYLSVEAQKNTTAAGLKEIQKSWMPQLDIWGNVYARGSGVDASGQINKSDGLNLSRTNAGIGLQLSFPVLAFSKVNIKKKQYQSLLKADEARLAQAQLDIRKQTASALLQYKQDIKIAAKSPVVRKAANDVYEGLKLSYETGLIDYTRLSEAQYELLKAEVNDANAHLQLWRSLLSVSIAKGDLNLFVEQLK